MEQILSVGELLKRIEKDFHKPNALAEKVNGEWVVTSHDEMIDQIKKVSYWLQAAGIKKGDMVGILALPSPRWTIVDLACASVGAISVPLFSNISEENFIFECTQTNLKTIFISGEDQWKMWEKHQDLFDRTVALDELFGNNKVISYNEVLSEGEKQQQKNPQRYHELLDEIKPDDITTIIYTSGSTGVPKGVVLDSRSLVSNTHCDPLNWDQEKDICLSILPLAHVFARTENYIMLAWGIPLYHFNDLKNVGEACREVHPTVIALVPRLLEKIYAKMVDNVNNAGSLKRTIGQWAFSLANEEEEGLLKTLMHPLADAVVYSHLREALGGSLRVVISGGAPLNPHLCHFFIDIGLPIYEGYGLTEASIVCVNNPKQRKIGSVGVKIEPLEVKTSEEGELLVKGDIVMREYYKNPKATADVLLPGGWLRTGDKAVIDNEGFITIVGRVKELVKTSVGEYIAPVPIEQQLGKAPLVDLAMIVAEKHKYVSCLIFPNFEVVASLKKSQKQESLTDEEFLETDYVKNEMNRLIEEVNSHINHWEQIRAYRFVPVQPTVETGELTPSMKIRREVVTEKYKELIQSMYPDEATV